MVSLENDLRLVPRGANRDDARPAAAAPTKTHRIGFDYDRNATPPRRIHWQALDGLRALAVIGVLVYHHDKGWMPGGFLGVDLFFTLSGYLITSILLSELEHRNRIDFKRFWVRRFKRLLPAVLLVGAVIGGVTLASNPAMRSSVRSDLVGTIFYFRNWQSIFTGGNYFEQFANPSPLLHTWSLAIEEQFYLVWPLVLIALVRLTRGHRTHLALVVCGLATASMVWAGYLYASGADKSRVYWGTDTRAQALLFGAALAVVWRGRSRVQTRKWRNTGEFAGAAALVALVVLWMTIGDDSPIPYLGGFALCSALAAVVISSTRLPGGTAMSVVLSWKPLRWIGAISYGLYLWHWPLYLWINRTNTGLDGPALFGVRLAVTFVAAAVSFYLVEQPIVKGRTQPARTGHRIAPVAVAASGVAVAVFAVTVGFVRDEPAAAARRTVEITTTTAAPTEAPQAPLNVMVVGDSVAHQYAKYFNDVAPQLNATVANLGVLGCGLVDEDVRTWGGETNLPPDTCKDRVANWIEYAQKNRPDVIVVISGVWEVQDHDGFKYGTPAFEANVRSGVSKTVRTLASLGPKVVLATTPYYNRPAPAIGSPAPFSENDPSHIDWFNRVLRDTAAENKGQVFVVDMNKFVTPNGQYESTLAGKAWNTDGVHFSPDGAALTAQWMMPQLRKITASK